MKGIPLEVFDYPLASLGPQPGKLYFSFHLSLAKSEPSLGAIFGEASGALQKLQLNQSK